MFARGAEKEPRLERLSGSPRRAELGFENLPANIGPGQQLRVSGAEKS
jgi:hypothetical protein